MATARRSAVKASVPCVAKWCVQVAMRARVSGSHTLMWLTSVAWWNWLRWARSVVTIAMPTLPPILRIMP